MGRLKMFDGVDNDGDGLIDEDDPGCAMYDGAGFFKDVPPCFDGVDNDGDRMVDGDDEDCISPLLGTEGR